jgi:hypothetical protein
MTKPKKPTYVKSWRPSTARFATGAAGRTRWVPPSSSSGAARRRLGHRRGHSRKKQAAQNDLKEAYKPKNIVNSFKAGYEEDTGNPVPQITRGVLDVGSLFIA